MQDDSSPKQSLHLIQSMIDKTKANISVNRFYFLLWGWIAFIGILGQFVLKVVLFYDHHYLVWLITFAGLIITVYHSRKRRSLSGVRTYIGERMSYLWTGVLACAASFFPFDYQLLFAAAAILSSYLIPGYMIQTEKKSSYA